MRESLSAKNDGQSYAHYVSYINRTFMNPSMGNSVYTYKYIYRFEFNCISVVAINNLMSNKMSLSIWRCIKLHISGTPQGYVWTATNKLAERAIRSKANYAG